MMIRLCLFVCLAIHPSLWAQFSPQSDAVTEAFFSDEFELDSLTPGLNKAKGFTDYEELMAFLNGLKADFPEMVTITFIGKSKKGKAIPMIHIKQPNGTDQHIRVFLQGGLHGDEPASTESVLYLLYDVLHNPDNEALRKHISLAAIPMANIDGYLKQSRRNAERLDLNRDQTKLMAHESVALKKAFTDFQPHVALDFHEYRPFRRDFLKMSSFGVSGAYDVMFLYSGNLNVPRPLREHTNEYFLEPTRQALDEKSISHFDYVTTAKHFGEVQFNRGSHNARSSATNYALLNTVAALIEVRGVGIGRTSFKRRVFTGYLVGKSFLDQSVNHRDATIALLNDSRKSDSITIRAISGVYVDTLDVIDLETNQKIPMAVTFRDALKSQPELSRLRPKAYYISCDEKALVSKLRTLGLQVDSLAASEEVEVERYRVLSRAVAPEKFEKMRIQNVEVDIEQVQLSIPAGTFVVRVGQSNANILTEVLEPEAPNGFIHFGLIRAKVNEYLPIYRLL